jgi:Ni/Co efflux regulator RcnB
MFRTLAYVVLTASLAMPVLAQGKSQGKGKGKNKDKDKGQRVVFVDDDRTVVRTWWTDTYGRGNCPPGLAKKHNGCLPPGQAKKRYVVGQRLPRSVVYEVVPVVLRPRLRPAPVGYDYVVVDGDVLLMQAATRLVADAIVRLIE